MPEAPATTQLWQILDRLRDDPAIQPHEIGPQLAALIYLRWADFQEAEREAIAAFDEDDYTPVLPAALHWRSWHACEAQQLSDMLARRLPLALGDLGNARHDPLATHLHRLAEPLARFEGWPGEHVQTLAAWLADQPFETPTDRRRLLAVFDGFLTASAGALAKVGGEHNDPPWLASLVAELGRPMANDRVYDPCFGAARFLVAAYDLARSDAARVLHRRGAPALSISGLDSNPSAFVIGLARLALAGVESPQLELGNSLERTAANNPHKEGFDLVLANPPWGMRVDSQGLDHFPVKSGDATGLFIQHALAQLKPDGRAVIVAPQGFLFRGGQDQRLRELLMEQHAVDTVIALPPGAFLPYTGVAACILVLGRKGPTQQVRMVDADGIIKAKREGTSVDQDQVRSLVELARGTSASKQAWNVDAEALAGIDWDLTPKHRNQSGLDAALDALAMEAPASPLGARCQIVTGRSFKSSDLMDEPLIGDGGSDRDVNLVPYIRIGDLRSGYAGKGAKWLSREAASSLDPKWKLRAGDILLSKSGTIGKAGIVRNGAVGAVAASGLLVLRTKSEDVDPHYLMAYLASSECQAWLDGRSRGSVVRHLSKKVLDDLPVPLPPIQVQQRVAEHHREHGVDAMSYLSQLLLEDEGDPIAEWMAGAWRQLADDKIGKPHDLKALLHAQVFGGGFTGLRHSVDRNAGDMPLGEWVRLLDVQVVKVLRDSDDVPPGPALFSLLQQADLGLQRALDSIRGHLPHTNRARELTQLVVKRVQVAMSRLVDEVDLVVSADGGRLARGSLVTIDLKVTNRGALPLRDLECVFKPWRHTTRIGFLGEGASKVVHVEGHTPHEQERFTLAITWGALAMDGRRIGGEREIAFELTSHHDDGTHVEDLGASPYICGDPITPKRDDVFVGREDLLERIQRQIKTSGNVVLLEGNRRAGKTSILKHLDGPDKVEGWLGVYTSLQGAEGSKAGVVGVATDEVFRTLAREIAKALNRHGFTAPLPNGSVLAAEQKPLTIPKACREGISVESPFNDFMTYIEVVLDALQDRGLGLLLMLDEFDKLQEGIDSGVTSPQVPENIRYLVQSYPGFSAILTGSRRLKRLREEYWSALYGLGTRLGVTTLDPEAARRLITAPIQGKLTYSEESIKRCIHLTARQPYLLQCLCNRIFDLAAQLKTRSITLDIVDRAAAALIEDNEHFASLWDYAETDRRRLLLAICHHQMDEPDPLRLGVIQERLSADGIEVEDEIIIADLDFLRELELIELIGDTHAGHYELAIPLMGTWIDQQRDVDAVLVGARVESEDGHA